MYSALKKSPVYSPISFGYSYVPDSAKFKSLEMVETEAFEEEENPCKNLESLFDAIVEEEVIDLTMEEEVIDLTMEEEVIDLTMEEQEVIDLTMEEEYSY